MTAAETASVPQFLTTEDVCERLRISRMKLYELRQEDGFPKPARLGYRTLRWREDEIDDWLRAAAASP